MIRSILKLRGESNHRLSRRYKQLHASWLVLLLAAVGWPAGAAPLFESTLVFESPFFPGSLDGYPHFRIPSLVTAPNGDLLAFAEGRQTFEDAGAGSIDIVGKRSSDGGQTWTPIATIAENGLGDVTNPTALVDHNPTSGQDTVWLFYNKWPEGVGESNVPPGTGPDSSTMWARTSIDNGMTWSGEQNLTSCFKPDDWRVASAGPGRGIQTQWGSAGSPAGRLIVPGWRTVETGSPEASGVESFTIYSDDHGQSWQLGGVTHGTTNESQLVELTDGSLLLDARQGGALNSPTRRQYRSTDGGETWSAPEPGLEVTEVMSSILRYSALRNGDDMDRLLFSAPSADGRFGMRVFLSSDEGETWEQETLIDPSFFSAYSSLTVLEDGTIGLFYETDFHFTMTFARFNLEYLAANAVPEPGATLLLGVGLTGLVLGSRRRAG